MSYLENVGVCWVIAAGHCDNSSPLKDIPKMVCETKEQADFIISVIQLGEPVLTFVAVEVNFVKANIA